MVLAYILILFSTSVFVNCSDVYYHVRFIKPTELFDKFSFCIVSSIYRRGDIIMHVFPI